MVPQRGPCAAAVAVAAAIAATIAATAVRRTATAGHFAAVPRLRARASTAVSSGERIAACAPR